MPDTPRPDLGLRSRGSTYTLMLGVVIGMLAAGLGIPFVFGESLETVETTASPLVPREDQITASDPAGPAQAGPGAPEVPGAQEAPTDGATADGAVAAPGTTDQPGTPADPAQEPGAGPAAGTGSEPAAAESEATSGLTASDRGVTPETITLAFLIVDLGGLSQFGFGVPGFDPESQRTYVRTFVDEVNADGGVLGRTLEPLFFRYDPTDPSSGQAACREATQDHEIFAALDVGGGLDFPGQLCFTEQNRTPLLELGGFGTTREMYDKSEGRLVTLQPSGIRTLANLGHELVVQGLLEGKTIGIVDRDFPGTVQTVKDGMVAALERLGYEVDYHYDFSMDNGVASSEVPVVVQQMRSRGVDAVMLLMDFVLATELVQTADRGGYRPDYFVSDFSSMSNDIAVSAMPSSFRAFGTTSMRAGEWRADAPEPALDADCRQTYAAATGHDPHRSESDYGGVMLSCGMIRLFAGAAAGAGPELTRDRWVRSIEQLGAFEYPFFGGFSFSPGKYDGADPFRTIVFDPACPGADGGGSQPCWMPAGGFRPPHY